jgi:hypothetical protein
MKPVALLLCPAYSLLCETLQEALDELESYYCRERRVHDIPLDSEVLSVPRRPEHRCEQ